jgi:dUTP pyrophosphatase
VTELRDDDLGPPVEVLVQQLDPELPLPSYAHAGDAGADLVSAVDVDLGPGERALLPTGLAIALPLGYAAFVHPRSGLAVRHGVTLVNAPGTIDAGYRGQLQVVLLNTDRSEAIRVRRGDRIGQLVIQRVEQAVFRPVDELPASVRGSGGFGSTGGFGSAGSAGSAADTAEPTGTREQDSTHATITDNQGGDGVPA